MSSVANQNKAPSVSQSTVPNQQPSGFLGGVASGVIQAAKDKQDKESGLVQTSVGEGDDKTTVTQFGSQSLATQTALNEAANKQQRLNMEKGAELDRINAEFFAGQDIRRTLATGAENRLATKVAGEETRATQRVAGEEDRATIATTGLEYRAGLETAGAQDRLLTETRGEQDRATEAGRAAEERLTVGKRGEEERAAIRETGAETRQLRETEGAQQRLGIETTGTQERLSEAERGKQERLRLGTAGKETRATNLQQEMFRRYKENRDFEQATGAYRV